MLPRSILASLAALALGAAASAQSIPDETGLTALRRRLGPAPAPTGAGVSAGQIEASAPGWTPDASLPDFAGKSFTFHSPAPSASGHATTVAQLYFGNSVSLAPAMAAIHCWEASHWLGGGFINGTGTTPPALSPAKVLNHSWIGSGSGPNFVHRKLDSAIDAQGLLVCVGVNNGAGPLDVPLLSHSFNSISCGRSDGQHRAGFTLTGYDRPGRQKPELVAPAGATSFSTPLISGACALLVETARTSLAGNADAERPEVIKAALMAGATHRPGWSNSAPTSGASRGATTTPLDMIYGADQIHLDRSHWILTAGEQAGAVSATAAPLVDPQGWERAQVSTGTSRYWRFVVESQKEHASVLATWNRQVTATFNGWSQPNFDLELWSVDAQGALTSLVGPAGQSSFGGGNVLSSSSVDNLEHLYVRDLQPGTYVLELRRGSDALAPWNVAIAWEFACDAPAVFGNGKVGSSGVEARLDYRGIPSRSGGGFTLEVRGGTPHANGVLFHGVTQAAQPFFGGTRYVANPVVRSGVLALDAQGALDIPISIDPAWVGSTRIFQFWYRDSAAPDGTGVGLTNAVRVSFCR
jgi:hypothetical protein